MREKVEDRMRWIQISDNYEAMLPGCHQSREGVNQDKIVLASIGVMAMGGRRGAGSRHDRLKGSRVLVGENCVFRKAMKEGTAIAGKD